MVSNIQRVTSHFTTQSPRKQIELADIDGRTWEDEVVNRDKTDFSPRFDQG